MSTIVEFDSPPVKHVRLTLYFETVEDLRASHLSALRESWREQYPAVSEGPPSPGHELGEGTDSGLIGIDDSWTMPQITFSNPVTDRQIALQSDRFSIGWQFNTEQTERYPGFEALRQELVDRFSEFLAEVESAVGARPVLAGAESRYMNEIEGIAGPALILGVLTGWQDCQAAEFGRSAYLGTRIHLEPSPERSNCTIVVGVDANGDDVPLLWIAVEHELSAEGRDTPLGGMDLAHEELVGTFLRITSDEQQRRWGRHG